MAEWAEADRIRQKLKKSRAEKMKISDLGGKFPSLRELPLTSGEPTRSLTRR